MRLGYVVLPFASFDWDDDAARKRADRYPEQMGPGAAADEAGEVERESVVSVDESGTINVRAQKVGAGGPDACVETAAGTLNIETLLDAGSILTRIGITDQVHIGCTCFVFV